MASVTRENPSMIKEYNEGDLSSGFVGIRVAVSVGGKIKGKWYSTKEFAFPTAMKQAKILEEKLLKKQREQNKNNVFSKRSNTGIKGLSFTFDMTKKRSGKEYAYPIILYQYRKNMKTRSLKWFLDSDLTITDNLWFDICNEIRNKRGLKNNTFDKLIAMKPNAIAYYQKNKPIEN